MDLHEAIRCRNFELFTAQLNSGANIAQLDADGNTVLHTLAWEVFKRTTTSEIANYFKPKAQVFDWLDSIMGEVPLDKKDEFVTIQNRYMDTCMHLAIFRENWEFARLMKKNYWFNNASQKLTKDKNGLNELDLFIKLYGTKGKEEHLGALFDWQIYKGRL